MTRYQKGKEEARQFAIEWQADFDNHNYSYYDLQSWRDVFYALARKWGLVREFKENGIL